MKQLEHTQEECKIQCKGLLMEASRKKAQLGLGWRKLKFGGGGGGVQGTQRPGQGPLGAKQCASLARTVFSQGGHPGAAGGMGTTKAGLSAGPSAER